MRLLLGVSLAAGVALTGGCAPGNQAQIIEVFTPQEAFALIQSNEDNPDFVIIDVRTPEEFAEGYIEDAINIDFNAETFRDGVEVLDRDKTYLIYCDVGRRSGMTLALMEDLEFLEVYDLWNGIDEWQLEGLPVVTE